MFAKNDKLLAYYYFKHKDLSIDVKPGISSIYKQYKEKYGSFALNNLKNYFINPDITNRLTSSSLSKKKE